MSTVVTERYLIVSTCSISIIPLEGLLNLNEPIGYVAEGNDTICVLVNETCSLPEFIIQEIKNGLPAIFVGYNSTAKIYDFVEGGPMEFTNGTIFYSGIKIYPQKISGIPSFEAAFSQNLNDTIQWAKNVWNRTELHPINGEINRIEAVAVNPEFYLVKRFYYYFEYEDKGKLNLIRSWYYVANEANPGRDYFALIMSTEVVPGTVAFGSDWRTSDVWNGIYANYVGDGVLADHEPTTTEGVHTVSYTIGVQVNTEGGGSAIVSLSESYSCSDVKIRDLSESDEQHAYWWHDVNEGTDVGCYTYVLKPAAAFEVPQDETWKMLSHYQARFGRVIILWWWEYKDTPLYEIITTCFAYRTLYLEFSEGGSTLPFPGEYTVVKHGKRTIGAIPKSGFRLAYWKIFREVDGRWEEYCVGAVNPIHLIMDYSYKVKPIFWKHFNKGGGGGGGGC
ncbi:MAG: hypothetical protein QW146_07880 [Candidatus Bathyarchaeia archaeon]